jgi:hypothetical protein
MRPGAHPDRQGTGAGARRPRHLRPPDGAPKTSPWAPTTARDTAPALPPTWTRIYTRCCRASRNAPRSGRHAVRRRAADAGHRPRADGPAALLLLDEPSMGLAPLMVEKVFEVDPRGRRRGHDHPAGGTERRLALVVCSRGYVMESGSITLCASSAELLADPRVRAAYLGE